SIYHDRVCRTCEIRSSSSANRSIPLRLAHRRPCRNNHNRHRQTMRDRRRIGTASNKVDSQPKSPFLLPPAPFSAPPPGWQSKYAPFCFESLVPRRETNRQLSIEQSAQKEPLRAEFYGQPDR